MALVFHVMLLLLTSTSGSGGVVCNLPPQSELGGTFSELTVPGSALFTFQVDLEGARELTIRPVDYRDAGYLILNYSGLFANAKVTVYLNQSLDLNTLNPQPIQPPDTEEDLPCNFTEPEPNILPLKESISYTLSCVDDDGKSVLSEIRVFIEPYNHKAPVFHCAPYHVEVSEMTPVSTTVFTLHNLAYDPDVFGGISSYTLQGSGPFTLTGATSVGNIVLNEPLDYDAGQTTYVLNVTVKDVGDPSPLYNSTLLYVHVTDSDDLAPVFTQDVYTLHLPEEDISVVNQPFSTNPPLLAYDGDKGIGDVIAYTIVKGHVVDGVKYFSLNMTSAQLIPLRILDRERIEVFSLVIKAYQVNNEVGRTAVTRVVVNVQDVNDNRPIMSQDIYDVTVQEHLAMGSFVHQVAAHDADKGNNSAYHFILDDPGGTFQIDSLSGVISILSQAKLDREATRTMTVQVYAVEYLTPEKYSSNMSTLTITLLDINDNSPVFRRHDILYLTVHSPLSTNTTITEVTASDMDQGLNGEVSYTMAYISSPRLVSLSVDNTTGRISNTDPVILSRDLTVVLVIQAEDRAVLESDRRKTSCVVEIELVAGTITKSIPTTDTSARLTSGRQMSSSDNNVINTTTEAFTADVTTSVIVRNDDTMTASEATRDVGQTYTSSSSCKDTTAPQRLIRTSTEGDSAATSLPPNGTNRRGTSVELTGYPTEGTTHPTSWSTLPDGSTSESRTSQLTAGTMTVKIIDPVPTCEYQVDKITETSLFIAACLLTVILVTLITTLVFLNKKLHALKYDESALNVTTRMVT